MMFLDPDEYEKNYVNKNQGYRDSSLAFDMPIAVAIFSGEYSILQITIT